MKFIPARDSSFEMGSTTGETDEMPVHTVTFTYGFFIDSTEVTQGQYSSLMAVTPSAFSGSTSPVEMVNWHDAALYCNARSKAEGSDTVYSYSSISGTAGNDCVLNGLHIDLSKDGYHLPTEAEWEYACRGGTTTDYYWGTDSVADYAWYFGGNGTETHPVAEKWPNAFGLYDMSGNVWEWCNDWHGSYAADTTTDPSGPASGTTRVLRGGAFDSGATTLRSARRNDFDPSSRNNNRGFRCVRRAP
jgi:formylglycine-generating enzyme required for sulfatase activity